MAYFYLRAQENELSYHLFYNEGCLYLWLDRLALYWLFGGLTETVTLTKCELYNVIKHKWSSFPSLNLASFLQRAVCCEIKMCFHLVVNLPMKCTTQSM